LPASPLRAFWLEWDCVFGEAIMNETVNATTAKAHAREGNHDRSLRNLLLEIKEEAKSFVETRVRIIKAEVQETLAALKTAVPLGALALGLFAIAGLLFTAAAVTLVASAFAGNPYAWFFGFIIIGCLWAIFGGTAAFFAVTQFRNRFPKRTIQVLKADKTWLQTEARSHL
jgi:uncharacterized membrane protein YqjE